MSEEVKEEEAAEQFQKLASEIFNFICEKHNEQYIPPSVSISALTHISVKLCSMTESPREMLRVVIDALEATEASPILEQMIEDNKNNM